MISIVACCHSAKLCAHAARDFWPQQNGAVTWMWRSCRVQPSYKERAIGVVRCKKEGMLLKPLRWRCVDCVIYHERDMREGEKYICVVRASNSKRDYDAWCLLLLAATVRSFPHMPLKISDHNYTVRPSIFIGCISWRSSDVITKIVVRPSLTTHSLDDIITREDGESELYTRLLHPPLKWRYIYQLSISSHTKTDCFALHGQRSQSILTKAFWARATSGVTTLSWSEA